MVEIEDCRYCAACCNSCIFLDYDKEENIFSCLIYKNKHRYRIFASDFSQGLNEYVLYGIKTSASNAEYSGLCDSHVCEKKKITGELVIDIRKVKNPLEISHSNLIDGWREPLKLEDMIKNIKEAREKVPNFDDLVEILNAV